MEASHLGRRHGVAAVWSLGARLRRLGRGDQSPDGWIDLLVRALDVAGAMVLPARSPATLTHVVHGGPFCRMAGCGWELHGLSPRAASSNAEGREFSCVFRAVLPGGAGLVVSGLTERFPPGAEEIHPLGDGMPERAERHGCLA